MNPHVIDSLFEGIKRTGEMIEKCPLDSLLIVRLTECECHGFTASICVVPLSSVPAKYQRLRAERTTTSLPVVVMRDNEVIHVRTLHWDEPRSPAPLAPSTPSKPSPPVRINSRGGSA